MRTEEFRGPVRPPGGGGYGRGWWASPSRHRPMFFLSHAAAAKMPVYALRIERQSIVYHD